MNEIKLSKRLTAAAELCRDGAFIADVGTDHAYLPIYLLQKEKIRGGVVSDINKGPIERAKTHIRENSFEDKLVAVLCDGLADIREYSVEDIFILGMGGELIAKIIDNAEWTKDKGIRLILQPMTHPELLRKFLWDNGYTIIFEKLVKEEKIYQIMAVEYSGKCETYNQAELLFGKINLSERSSVLYELFEHTERVMADRIKGKEKSDADTSFERNLIKQIGELK